MPDTDAIQPAERLAFTLLGDHKINTHARLVGTVGPGPAAALLRGLHDPVFPTGGTRFQFSVGLQKRSVDLMVRVRPVQNEITKRAVVPVIRAAPWQQPGVFDTPVANGTLWVAFAVILMD